jgi:hypothetical protein
MMNKKLKAVTPQAPLDGQSQVLEPWFSGFVLKFKVQAASIRLLHWGEGGR